MTYNNSEVTITSNNLEQIGYNNHNLLVGSWFYLQCDGGIIRKSLLSPHIYYRRPKLKCRPIIYTSYKILPVLSGGKILHHHLTDAILALEAKNILLQLTLKYENIRLFDLLNEFTKGECIYQLMLKLNCHIINPW